MIARARTAAFHTLRAVNASLADLPAALARSRARLADDRDRALAGEIATGTLRWQRALDHLIEHFARRAPSKIDADVLVILRLSLYQLLHLDRVPASAVVDDGVELTRAAKKGHTAGFVNAVLRALLRQRHRLPLPARPGDAADREAALRYLGITHSHPDWLVGRWLDRYGFEASERWVRFNNETPALALRANRLVVSRESLQASLTDIGVDTMPTIRAPHGLVVSAGNPFGGADAGTFFVQDEASQLVALAAGARPGEDVLDLCASPGNKTTQLAEDMENRGVLVACDVRPRRLTLLQQTLRRSGAAIARVVHVDAAGALPFARRFDRVLVDAPCSGLGTVRRDPDIRWRRSESELAALSARQVELLARAAEAVKTAGRLVYATCSSEPEENDGVVRAFLDRHPDFELVDLRSEGVPALRDVIDATGMLRTLPFMHGLEAFFAAAMIRRGT
jgi:16S rRNA (cytosine967-C5)-methyltransferase